MLKCHVAWQLKQCGLAAKQEFPSNSKDSGTQPTNFNVKYT